MAFIPIQKQEIKIGLSNPFNYTGSKHRYLKDLFEILPTENNLKVSDPFFGGGDLSTHLNKTWSVDASDENKKLIELHQAILDGDVTVEAVSKVIQENNLNKENKEEFYLFRDKYNQSKNPLFLYALICHSFSNYLRFNSDGNFHAPFGERCFNPSLQKKLSNYIDRLNERKINFSCKSVFDINFSDYDLVFIDPPYLNTTATYNEGGGWTSTHEKKLHNQIENLHCKFIYFGQTVSNGIENKQLIDFASKYKTKVLKNTTDNCSATKLIKRKGKENKKTVEVMIWNF